MVVKSHSGDQHLVDLEKMFGEIRKYDMCLNPEKCTFGVDDRKVFGLHDHPSKDQCQPKQVYNNTRNAQPCQHWRSLEAEQLIGVFVQVSPEARKKSKVVLEATKEN